MSSPNFNGRVNIMSPNTSILFSMQDKIPTENKASAFKDAMTGNWYNTSLSDAFFSKENIQSLQNGLRAGVMQKSNGQYVIGEQNTDQLKIIMRSVYLQYSNNVPVPLLFQIGPNAYLIISKVKRYLQYTCEF